MKNENVVALNGGLPQSVPKVSKAVIDILEDYLEKAKSGEVVAFVGAVQHCDGLSSYSVAGYFGPYSVLGALRRAEHDLNAVMDEVE